MEKQFESIAELVKDQILIEYVEKKLKALRAERNKRPEPKKGFRYVRDWYDRMTSENQLNVDFFLKNIEAIWNKKSNLNSERRQVIQYVCDQALYQMNEYYANLPEPEAIPVVKKKRASKKVAIIGQNESTVE